jgi:membrane protein
VPASPAAEPSEKSYRLGRRARQPLAIPRRGWRKIGIRLWQRLGEDNLGLIAGGVAYFSLLALFPGLAAVVSAYALFSDPAQVTEQLRWLDEVMPQPAIDTVVGQLRGITQQAEGILSSGFYTSLVLSLWSARRAMRALISACNVAYREIESRGIIDVTVRSVIFTLASIVAGTLSLALIVGVPGIISVLGLTGVQELLAQALQWLMLAAFAITGLSLLYRWAPDRRGARWQWLSLGSVIATVLWMAASLGFSAYVANSTNFNATYGALAGVVILIIWFYITAFAAILGAAVNAEAEFQTGLDSTVGADRPMGERGAHVADHLPESR